VAHSVTYGPASVLSLLALLPEAGEKWSILHVASIQLTSKCLFKFLFYLFFERGSYFVAHFCHVA
jgi:hypothetical protein